MIETRWQTDYWLAAGGRWIVCENGHPLGSYASREEADAAAARFAASDARPLKPEGQGVHDLTDRSWAKSAYGR